MPRRAWFGVSLAWVRTLALAIVFVQVGRVVDVLTSPPCGAEAHATILLAVPFAFVAVVCAGLAATEPPRLRAAEESAWRGRAVRALLAHDPRPGRTAGSDVSRLTDGVERVAAYRAEFLGPTLAAFTAPLLVLMVLAVAVDPITALLLAVLVALVPFVVAFFMRLFRKPNTRYRRLAGQASARFHETLRSLGALVLLNAAGTGRTVVARAAEDLRREVVGMLRRNQLMILVNDALFSLVMVTAAVGLALYRHHADVLTVGDVVATVLLATLLHEPIDKVGRSFYIGMAGRAQQGDLSRLVDDAPPLPPETPRPAGPVALEIRDVTVHHGKTPVLTGVDVSVPAGGVLAVVGPSGAGKSTLASAVQGLLPFADGQVRVDGRPADAADLRRTAVTVSQRPYLFTGSIAENLRLASPNAGDAQLWEALRLARVDREVEAMPQGLATAVGESGSMLSGGQVRRLAIARAVLSNAPLLVLDEPTADLDRRTEELVSSSLRNLARERTLVLIAHRLRTTMWADLVLVLVKGRPVAAGPPDTLLGHGGYYADATAGEGE